MQRAAIVIVLALGLASPGSLPGQQRRAASSFWYGVSVGPGWARITCDLCAGDRQTGISASLALGGTAARGLRVGGELSGWRESHAGVTQTLMSVSASAYWHPNPRSGLYLRGGAALVMHRAADGTDVVTSSGIGPQFGIGYDYNVSRSWRVSPIAHYAIGVFGGDVKFNGGQAAGSATVSFLQVGASLTRRGPSSLCQSETHSNHPSASYVYPLNSRRQPSIHKGGAMKTALKLLAVAAVFLAPRPSAAQSVATTEPSAGPLAIQESDGELSPEVQQYLSRGDEMTKRLRFDRAALEYRRAADVARREGHLASGTTWKAATAYFTGGNPVAAAGVLDQLADDAARVGDLQVEALSIYFSAWLNAKAGRKAETAAHAARLESLLRSRYMPIAVRDQLNSWLANAKVVAIDETN